LQSGVDRPMQLPTSWVGSSHLGTAEALHEVRATRRQLDNPLTDDF
jgi:hypothetical protein